MLVIVGGNSRKAGKTSYIEKLIRKAPERHWSVVKITTHPHKTHPGLGDTGRYRHAGAKNVYLIEAPELEQALSEIRQILSGAENVIIESNRILDYLKPDLCVFVLDFAVADMKQSCRRHLDKADIVVLSNDTGGEPPWPGITRDWLNSRQPA
jgi:hypothetical protein